MRFIKAKDIAKTASTPAPPAAPETSCSRAQGHRRNKVHVRLEGAPWFSLRDRCGAPQIVARDTSRISAEGRDSPKYLHGCGVSKRASGWRSLSRLEAAMVLVLVALLAAVFQGVRSEPLLASAPPDAPPPAALVSLAD